MLNPSDSVNDSKCEIKTVSEANMPFYLVSRVFKLFYCDSCFTELALELFVSQVQCCTGCATEQVYYIRKDKHMELLTRCKHQKITH